MSYNSNQSNSYQSNRYQSKRKIRPSLLDRLIDDAPDKMMDPPLTSDEQIRALKESVRRDMAIYQLQCNTTSVSTIAYMLGFSEPSAFHRAFKQWTGQTPGDYRTAAL